MDFVDPFTGGTLYTLPIHLDHTATYYDTTLIKNVQSPLGEFKQTPVYKYTVEAADDGYLELTGLNGSTTRAGDVYAKAEYPIITAQAAIANRD